MSDVALSIKNLGLTLPSRIKLNLKGIWDKHRILSGLNFDVKRGEIVALVGRNGCGKSTLFRVISGIYAPTEGSIQVANGGRVSVMALSMGFMPQLTGRENVVLQGLISGMALGEAKLASDEVIDSMPESRLSKQGQYDLPYGTYSAGMKATISSSSALLKDADVILVDEVFGVGDEIYRHNLAKSLREKAAGGAAVIIVSHDTEVLRTLCTRAVVLQDGQQVSANMSIDDAIRSVGVSSSS